MYLFVLLVIQVAEDNTKYLLEFENPFRIASTEIQMFLLGFHNVKHVLP